jgi:ribosome-binding factor A
MNEKRIKRLNSLLKEVISEVIQKDVKNPNISKLTTITEVDITADLKTAKVFVSVIGTDQEKQKTLDALNHAAGFISINASKKVVLRYFPALTFEPDTSLDKHMKIDSILKDIKKEKDSRSKSDE